MASARQRDGRWTGLYRDQQGDQRSAGTYDTEKAALKATTAAEAIEATGRSSRFTLSRPIEIFRTEKNARLTVAECAPAWLSGHRLEPTSRACYQAMIKHIIRRGNGYVISVRRVLIEVADKISERDYGKTARATRDVTIDTDLGEALTEAARQSAEGFVFRAGHGGELTRSNFRRVWIRALTAAGLTGVRVHVLRHTHASWLVSNGCDLVTVRDRLGHSDIKVTSRYLHVVPGEHDRGLDALSAALAAQG